ncbi:hypothetical protein [Clostridium massiliodielmoense]|uniref:hypothetical protein n=1 Tax=Clostridium massiliodielmoense TaxID=1776385 RepID=UPI0004D3DFCB|nr:hypothetical protein [Clostridium massiliodielmoense]KEH98008.1 hypothetical protein Z962_01475 [Clostridium botulinum C/D str. BKT12695]
MLKILEYKITNINIILPVLTLTRMGVPMWICEMPKTSVYFGIIVCILSIIKMVFNINKNFKL